MEIGMGIHGEPGIKRVRMMNSRDLARELCPAVLKDLSIAEGERVAVLVNGLGKMCIRDRKKEIRICLREDMLPV